MESALIGIDRVNRSQSGVLDDIDGTHPQHHLVFDDKHVRDTIEKTTYFSFAFAETKIGRTLPAARGRSQRLHE